MQKITRCILLIKYSPSCLFVNAHLSSSSSLNRPRRGFILHSTLLKMDTKMNFPNMKVTELRQFLDGKGLPKNGNKQALVERAEVYWEHLQKQQNVAESRSVDTEVKQEMAAHSEPESDVKTDQSGPFGNITAEIVDSTSPELQEVSEKMVSSDTDKDSGVSAREPSKDECLTDAGTADQSGPFGNITAEIVDSTSPELQEVYGKMVSSDTDKDSGVYAPESSKDECLTDAGTATQLKKMVDSSLDKIEENNFSDDGIKNVSPEEPMTDVVESSGKKRNRRDSHPYPNKRPRQSLADKTPAQLVNEAFPGTKFEVVESGGVTDPWFKMSVAIHDQTFTGTDRSKKLAKQACAENVLRKFMPEFFCSPPGLPPLPTHSHMLANVDFTSDDPVLWSFFPGDDVTQPVGVPMGMGPPFGPGPVDLATSMYTSPDKMPTTPKNAEDAHPVSLLNEMIPNLAYEFQQSGKVFKAKITLGETDYTGEGRSKKLAKVVVATKVLREKYGITSNKTLDQLPVASTDDESEAEGTIVDAGKLPDLVCDLVKEKFAYLTDDLTNNANHKVLAGIVMTRENGPDVNAGEVVCVATGTKCIDGGHLSDTGTALHDCHAEIICRRGLRKFLYEQLMLYTSDKENCIFEACDDNGAANTGYRLKSNVFFHLYINTSPCGDSRIFSPHETKQHHDDHPNRISRGLLRTKIEAGEGTVPIQSHLISHDGTQPWDSIISGERLLTMSCSDKLARWNVLGLQGSLLSLYIEPIYMSSIVLGSLYHGIHLSRGLFSRVKEAVIAVARSHDSYVNGNSDEKISDLAKTVVKEPFKLHRPLLAPISNPEGRKPSKAPSFCFHWTAGDQTPTVLHTSSGKLEGDIPSNLCKMQMYELFHKLKNNIDMKPRINIPDDCQPLSYGEMKKLSTEYQELKMNLYAGFKTAGFGTWVKKPAEVDGFLLDKKN